MSDDFHKLIEDVESEVKAEGPAAETELRELRREFSMASQLMTLRCERKLTQEQLSKMSGIPQSEISRIETGDANPTYATLSALAEPLGARIGFIRPMRQRDPPLLMTIRLALFGVPAAVVVALVLVLNAIDASAGVAVAALGVAAAGSGIALGYFVDYLPKLPRTRRIHPMECTIDRGQR